MEKKDFKSLGIKLPNKFKHLVIDYYRIDTDGLPIFHFVQDVFKMSNKKLRLCRECCDWLSRYMYDHGMLNLPENPRIEDCDLLPGAMRFEMPFQNQIYNCVVLPVAI